jgi:hypothetical protein
MKRRRWLILGLIVATVVAPSVVWAPRPRVTRARFDRVTEGMTRDEMIATVGVPPGDYTTEPFVYGPETSLATTWRSEQWLCDEAELRVRFGDDGRATWVRVRGQFLPPIRRSWFDRLRQRLGL